VRRSSHRPVASDHTAAAGHPRDAPDGGDPALGETARRTLEAAIRPRLLTRQRPERLAGHMDATAVVVNADNGPSDLGLDKCGYPRQVVEAPTQRPSTSPMLRPIAPRYARVRCSSGSATSSCSPARGGAAPPRLPSLCRRVISRQRRAMLSVPARRARYGRW
jgi:hypothetical protein